MPPSSYRARSTWILACALFAYGCAASQPATTPASPPRAAPLTAAPGELRMRHPDEVRSSAARTRALGVLEPVRAAKKASAEPRTRQPTAAGPRAPLPIRVARDAVPRPQAVRDGQLLLPSGLAIRGVPKSVSIRSVREQGGGDVWEFVDARGQRLALLKAESLSRSLLPRGATLDELASARSIGTRSDWGAPRVRVVSERFLSENYLYTIERRTRGTGWISSGLEFGAHP